MFFRNENYARGGETVLDIAVCSTVGENLKYVKEGNRRNEMKEGEGDSMMRWKRRDHCCQYASPKKKKKTGDSTQYVPRKKDDRSSVDFI